MARTDWERSTGGSTLRCWCETVDRKPHDWRETNGEHSIAFEPDDPFPDGEFAPCPAAGCSGQVRLKPAPAPKPKKARKKRTTKKKATK